MTQVATVDPDHALSEKANEAANDQRKELVNTIVGLALSRLEELKSRHERAVQELWTRRKATDTLTLDDSGSAVEQKDDSQFASFSHERRLELLWEQSKRRSSSASAVLPKIRFHSLKKIPPTTFLQPESDRDYVHLLQFNQPAPAASRTNSGQPFASEHDISGYNFYAWKLKTDKRPLKKLVEKPQKSLGTREWRLVDEEVRHQQLYERIDQLKDKGVSSLYQFKRFTAPLRPTTHWDYLLNEAAWLQTDFKQEARWKRLISAQLARECARKASQRASTGANTSVSEPSVLLNDAGSTYWSLLPECASLSVPLTPNTPAAASTLDLVEDADIFQFAAPRADDLTTDTETIIPITKVLQTPIGWKPPFIRALVNPDAELSAEWFANTRIRAKRTVILPFESHDGFIKDPKKEKFIPEPYAHRMFSAAQRPRLSSGQPQAATPTTATNSVIHVPEWSPYEDDLLFILVKHYGHNWSFISQALHYFQLRGGPSQPFFWSPWQCYYRYSELSQPNKSSTAVGSVGGSNSGAAAPAAPHTVREPFAQKMRVIDQKKRKRYMSVFDLIGRLAKRRDVLRQKQKPKTPTSFTGDAQQQLENLLKEKTEYRTPTELIYLREQDEKRAKLQSLGQREQVLAALRQSNAAVSGSSTSNAAKKSAAVPRMTNSIPSASANQLRAFNMASCAVPNSWSAGNMANMGPADAHQGNMPLVNQLGTSIGNLRMSPKASAVAKPSMSSPNPAKLDAPQTPSLKAGSAAAGMTAQQRAEYNKRLLWMQQIRQAVANGRMTPVQAAALEQQLQQQMLSQKARPSQSADKK